NEFPRLAIAGAWSDATDRDFATADQLRDPDGSTAQSLSDVGCSNQLGRLRFVHVSELPHEFIDSDFWMPDGFTGETNERQPKDQQLLIFVTVDLPLLLQFPRCEQRSKPLHSLLFDELKHFIVTQHPVITDCLATDQSLSSR